MLIVWLVMDYPSVDRMSPCWWWSFQLMFRVSSPTSLTTLAMTRWRWTVDLNINGEMIITKKKIRLNKNGKVRLVKHSLFRYPFVHQSLKVVGSRPPWAHRADPASSTVKRDLQKVLAGIEWKLVPIVVIRYAPWHSNGDRFNSIQRRGSITRDTICKIQSSPNSSAWQVMSSYTRYKQSPEKRQKFWTAMVTLASILGLSQCTRPIDSLDCRCRAEDTAPLGDEELREYET